MEKITHRATCAFPDCGSGLVGGTRQQGEHERFYWVHTVRMDELKGGLHTAYPLTESIEEI